MGKVWTSSVSDGLTALEQDVIDAARRGEWAGPDTGWVEHLAVTGNPDLCVRAELIRELLMGRHGELDPRGVRIRCVRVVGLLDLDRVSAITSLTLWASAMLDGFTCQDAQLHKVDLSGSLLSFLSAEGLRTDENLVLRDAIVRGPHGHGSVRLLGAQIGGQLNLDGIAITNTGGPALHADSLRTDKHLFLRNATVRGAGKKGALCLVNAHIGGEFGLDWTTVTNPSGPALHADNLRTDNHFHFRDAIINGTGEGGAIRLLHAHIGGYLHLFWTTITNVSGPALRADRLQTDDHLFLRDTIMRGTSEDGAVRLLGAHIKGQLHLDRAAIANISGPALYADSLRTDEHLFFRDATVRGTGENGAANLLGAHIGRQLHLDRTTFVNTNGPAIRADILHTDEHLFFRDATVRSEGEDWAVRLIGAHIGGQAIIHGTTVSNSSGNLISFTEMRVEGTLVFQASLACPEGREVIGRQNCSGGARKIGTQAFVFNHLANSSWRQWLHILVYHTTDYRPQPFQHLAAVERAAGHDNNARQILITQQESLRRRAPNALGGRMARGRHRLWGWLGRYGYRAHRLVIALIVILILAGTVAYAAGQVPTRPDHYAAERVSPTTTNPPPPAGTPCSTAELIGLGIDRGLPLGATGLRARCDLDTATRRGQAFTFVLWGLQALLWALVTLAVAAYTGLVRKPT
ncbi:hypothetical protein ACFYOT_41375 [Saccharothrix saharensis]|uniref:hypothetical protein n=1 Tax=Saccharothrix saharensis TaxID=571190 RepID=UPI00368330A7